MSDYYVLDHNLEIQKADLLTWSKFFESDTRLIAKDQIGNARISTVFLGIDHSWGDKGPPVLFETMIFEGVHDQYQTRCCTYQEALEMHKIAVELVKSTDKAIDI